MMITKNKIRIKTTNKTIMMTILNKIVIVRRRMMFGMIDKALRWSSTPMMVLSKRVTRNSWKRLASLKSRIRVMVDTSAVDMRQ
jgi:hypothetical protein